MPRLTLPFSEKSVDQWREQWRRSAVGEERFRALLALFTLGDIQEAFAASLASLQDGDPDVRSLAAKQLGEWKRRTVAGISTTASTASGVTSLPDDAQSKVTQALELLLTDGDADVRFEAARALVRWGGNLESARDVLLLLLDAEESLPIMKGAILNSLGESFATQTATGDDSMSVVTKRQRDILRSRIPALLVYEQPEIREAASTVLVSLEIDPTEYAEVLISGLDDEEPVVRENVAIALGRCRVGALDLLSPRLEQALETAATDDDEGVANAANAALEMLRKQHTETRP